ncbi:MAG: RelA/SpoT family protein [Saprospiraceae bacterium]|nr:RelA/SpoT family protein [Saprospiraceae bacterium]MDW8228338.1 RelA/SpoT family protein [Saprospiraceae bacterium]
MSELPPSSSSDEYARIVKQGYRRLLRGLPKPLSEEDRKAIRNALNLAAEAHRNQTRKTGEPYILHPIAVAQICVEEIGLGPTAVVCALLHDVVEDTSVTLEVIRERFGERVALIVDGLTKLDKSMLSPSFRQAENLARVMRAMLVDVRVVLIKMADRLHNMRTIKGMSHEAQIRIAAETDAIYTPLAHRLGLYNIKTEFQDIFLKIVRPDEYREIADKLAQTKRAREQYIRDFIRPIEEDLRKNMKGLKFRILGRPKSIYSIWNKMRKKEVAFEDIYDLFAIRIILDVPFEEERLACWQVYAIVTNIYQNVPARQKDWITTPKANGYESLHTTVIGPGGKYVEVQIRTERMNEIAERGYAAHWKYKGLKLLHRNENIFEKWFSKIREVLENSEAANANQIMTDFEDMMPEEEVYVLTPKGEIRFLKEGATALDFAFDIHSDIGCSCRAIRVNGSIVPFSYVLKNGDQVSIETDKNCRPSPDWLRFVKTSKAKNRIRAFLKKERFKTAAEGLEILDRKMRRLFNCPAEEHADMLAKWYGFDDRLEFLVAVALEQVDLSRLKELHLENGLLTPTEQPFKTNGTLYPAADDREIGPATHPSNIIINDEPGNYYAYTLATCCNPLPGDNIFAYITAKEGIKIHRIACSNAPYLMANYAYRILPAHWGNTAKSRFVATISVTGIDDGPGIIQRISDHISSMDINIRSFSISGEDGYFEGRIALVVANTHQLHQVIKDLKKLKFIASVGRVE